MMVNLFVVLCLSAPASAFVAQPQVVFHQPREGVRLASFYLDSLEHKQGYFGQDTPTDKVLDQTKFLDDMARELEAVDELTNKVDASIDAPTTTFAPAAPIITMHTKTIVPGAAAASERLERLVLRANEMCARYDLECAELRASGVIKKAPRRSSDTVVTPFAVLAVTIAAAMLAQNPTLLMEQLPNIQDFNLDLSQFAGFPDISTLDFQTTFDINTADLQDLQFAVMGQLVAAKQSVVAQAAALQLPDTQGFMEGVKDALVAAKGNFQAMVRSNFNELKLALQQNALLLHSKRPALDSILTQVAGAQELARTKVASIELPNMDVLLQKAGGMQSTVLSQVAATQELAHTKVASIEVPNVDALRQKVDGIQGTVLSRVTAAQELVLTKAASIEVPDMDVLLQKVDGMQSTVLSHVIAAQERAKAVSIELPNMDGLLRKVGGMQSTILSQVAAAQELVLSKTARIIEVPNMDALLQKVDGLQSTVLSQVNEVQDTVVSPTGNKVLTFDYYF